MAQTVGKHFISVIRDIGPTVLVAIPFGFGMIWLVYLAVTFIVSL